METALYQRFFEIEEDYWWSVWMRRMVTDWLPAGPAERRILDMGCGTGIISQEMGEHGHVVSLDYAEEALRFCRLRRLPRLLRGDGQALPFAAGSFDVVLALDTIEHVPDDAEAVREMRRVLKPDGLLILNVPALRLLWSSHDVANQHHRRYHRPQLRALIEDAGFTLTKLTYSNFVFFPPTLLLRLMKRLVVHTLPSEEILTLSPRVNQLIEWIMRGERRVLRHINLPVGTSLFAVATPGPPHGNGAG